MLFIIMPGKDMTNQENQCSIWLTKTSSQTDQLFPTTENMLKSRHWNLIESIQIFLKQFLSPRKLLFYIPNVTLIIITYVCHGSERPPRKLNYASVFSCSKAQHEKEFTAVCCS